MCVWRFGGCAEAQAFVTFGEFYVEVGDQSLNKIISPHCQCEVGCKIQIGLGDCVEIDLFDEEGVRHNLFGINHID